MDGSSWLRSISAPPITYAAIGDAGLLEARMPGPDRSAPEGIRRQPGIVYGRRGEGPKHREIPIDPRNRAVGDHHGSTLFQHQRFIEMIRFGRVPTVTIDDGLRAVATGAAAEESVKLGKPVEIVY